MSSKSSKTEGSPAEALPDRILVGVVRRPHGVRGEVLIEVFSDVPERFTPGCRLGLRLAGGERSTVRVTAARPHKGALLLGLEGVEHRDAAAKLRGAVLDVCRSETPLAPEGSYYYYELTGCRCRDRRLGELGTVVDLLEDGGGLLLRVVGERGELPVPFVSEFLVEVDVTARSITVDLPAGLVEACASTS